MNIRRKLVLVICFFFLLNLSQFIFGATTQCNGTSLKPCIVQDTENNTAKIKHWRTSNDIKKAFAKQHGNVKGLEKLWMSGSGQPSIEGLNTIAVKIIKHTENKVEHIVDLDLRQESHGYLNDNAITLAAQNDWVNLGKSHEQVLKEEKKWLKSLRKQKNISDVLTPQQFEKNQFTQGKTIKVESIGSEDKIAKNANFNYFRLTVSDHMAPSDAEVDRFITFIKTMKPHTWIHFHCRGGNGRTTTFMAMYDMLHNANKVSLETIIQRQAAVAPDYNLFKVSRKHKEFTKHYQKRKEFLTKFYQFSQAYLKGYAGTWSDWVHSSSFSKK